MLSYEALAKTIDHALLHPTLTDEDLKKGCELAKFYQTASVCIKPYAVKQAKLWLAESGVKTSTVIGFPHGSNTTAIKVAECNTACADGAEEVDIVVNIGKVLSGDWPLIKEEIHALHAAAEQYGAIIKVIFENDYLQNIHKIRLCEICSEVGVAFVKTSTGFGFKKDKNGNFNTGGATLPDIQLMRQHCSHDVQIKASGGIRTLKETLEMIDAGASRIGTTSTAVILEEIRQPGKTGNGDVSEPSTSSY